ncbi:hypothetical protein F2Q70_00005833 [Brassica cretica]|uniref:Uncharacterized protein n=1 Tax=Brassica cretica TaxID=69181 RepID=A0A8S9IMT7_BRACR|nr:hypothetical protein F2Q70_00005833 [Brassica cretica]
MAAISSLFLVFTLFIVSLLTILALIVRPRPVKIPGGGSSGIGLADKPLLKNRRRGQSSTSIIASSSGSMKTREVAKICLDGIKSGKFTATCHFIGYLLSIATSGVSPQRSFWHAFMEVMFGGLIRFVGLFFQWGCCEELML